MTIFYLKKKKRIRFSFVVNIIIIIKKNFKKNFLRKKARGGDVRERQTEGRGGEERG